MYFENDTLIYLVRHVTLTVRDKQPQAVIITNRINY